jgi:sarcosine oxidase subunit alpha
VLTRTTAALFGDHNFVVLSQRVTGHVDAPEGNHVPRERIWKVRARQVVLATGATERPLVFPDNDRPGIMLASAAGDYVHRYGVRPGRTAVVAGNNDSIYPLASDLRAAGVRVVALADARNEPSPLAEVARADGVEILTGHAVTGTKGRMRLRGVSLAPIADDGLVSGNSARRFSCDLLCVSGGFSPTAHLLSQAGGRLTFDEKRGCLVPAHIPRGIRMAGSANGTFELAAVLAEGEAAGVAAAEAVGLTAATGRGPFAHSGRSWLMAARRSSLSTFTTTQRLRISRSPRAKGIGRSSMSNGIRRLAWARTRANLAT